MTKRPAFVDRATAPKLYESWVAEELDLIAQSQDPHYLNDLLAHRDLRVVFAALAHPHFPKAARRDLLRQHIAKLSETYGPNLTRLDIDLRVWSNNLLIAISAHKELASQPNPWYAKSPVQLPSELCLVALSRSPSLTPQELTTLLAHPIYNHANGLELIDILDIEPEHSVRRDILNHLLTHPETKRTTLIRCHSRLLARPGLSDAEFVDSILSLASLDALSAPSLSCFKERLALLSKENWARLIGSPHKNLRLFALNFLQNLRPSGPKI